MKDRAKVIITERLANLKEEEIPEGSLKGYFCSLCGEEVSVTPDSLQRGEGAPIGCVQCYKNLVIPARRELHWIRKNLR